jgi:hypothetical protein
MAMGQNLALSEPVAVSVDQDLLLTEPGAVMLGALLLALSCRGQRQE